MPWLCVSSFAWGGSPLIGWSVDQLDDSCSEVGIAPVGGGAFDPIPDHLGEVAGDRTAASTGREAGQVEPDPADDVVDGIGARARERVVDGEEQVGAEALGQGVGDGLRVPLRARVGKVRPDRQVAGVALEDPVTESLRARASVASVDVEDVEGARRTSLPEGQGGRVADAEA